MAATNRRRKTFDDLIEEEAPPQPPVPPEVDPPPEQPVGGAGDPRRPVAPRPRRSGGRESVTSEGVPKWQTMERKETFLRPGQLDELTALRRRLKRARGRTAAGERITENTLIRVAVDLLLDRADQLSGATEDELRKSVTPGVRRK